MSHTTRISPESQEKGGRPMPGPLPSPGITSGGESFLPLSAPFPAAVSFPPGRKLSPGSPLATVLSSASRVRYAAMTSDTTEPPKLSVIEAIGLHIKCGKHISSPWEEACYQAIIALSMVIGGLNFWIPSVAYATDRDLGVGLGYYMGVSVAVASSLVLYKATDIYIKMRKARQLTPHLAQVAERDHAKWKAQLEDVMVWLTSTVASVPIAVTVFLFPPKGATTAELIFYALAVLAANAVLHLLAVKLFFGFLANIPVFRQAAIFLYECTLTQSKQRRRAKRIARHQQYDMLKQKVIERLKQAQAAIEEKSLIEIGATYRINQFPTEVYQKIKTSTDDQVLFELCKLVKAAPEDREPVKTSWSDIIIGGLGAIWVLSGAIGAVDNAWAVLREYVDNISVALGCALIFMVPLALLIGFMGFGFVLSNKAYWTGVYQQGFHLPFEARLYPKRYYLMVAVSLALSAVGFANVVTLIDHNLTEPFWEPVLPFFLACAYSSAIFMSYNAIISFYFVVVEKSHQYLCQDSRHDLAMLKAIINGLVGDISAGYLDALIPRLRGRKWLAAFYKMSEQQRNCLGISPTAWAIVERKREASQTSSASTTGSPLAEGLIPRRNSDPTLFQSPDKRRFLEEDASDQRDESDEELSDTGSDVEMSPVVS